VNIAERYIQYSKLFTSCFGVAYLLHVISTVVLICLFPEQAEYLLDALTTTTGLFGLVFGCYTGNSTIEKYINKKALTAAVMGETAQTKQSEG